ncbi:YkvA family protein [Brevundimonas sp.]|uniref:YkvA family protein n=1 Tax=Brevundimonas sp. TaxID=1871086 RepID=UPI00391DBF87
MTPNAKPSSIETPEQALEPSRALVPATIKVNAERVRRGFWPKIRRTATRIPFAREAVAAWHAARDPETPFRAKAMMLAGLGYFVMPVDVIPDVFVGIGFTDDAAVIAAMIALVGSHIRGRHYQSAERTLEALRNDRADARQP